MVSLIIVNYNGGQMTVDCLRSLRRQTLQSFEVIIVDNGSSDGSITAIGDFLRGGPVGRFTKIVPLENNLGFAGGNTAGMAYATGEYIALLNNDTEPDERWLEELMKCIGNDSGAGACASRLLVYGGATTDSAGDCFTRLLKGDKRGEGKGVTEFLDKEYVFGACAGAALYRRDMFEEIGFLDDDFFLIHEDTDLNFRAQLAGWKVLYVPTAVVYHKVRSSIGAMSDLAVYYTLRNSELLRMKSVPAGIIARCLPELILGMLSEFTYFAIKHRRLKLFLRAKHDALRMLPNMLKKRKEVMKTKKVSNRYLLSIMTPVWQKDFFKAKLGKFLYD
ncbi:MAG: putative glycosyltransferase EpsH [Syntrophorhabdus sp. PtaB.Bin006]|nr:MAG: putative glycosyltransferase EpsH [Syntrophorhabdus sp. PtaB.Bin006]